MMVVFHFAFDLSFFSLYPIELQSGFWRYFGYSTASLFVFIAGVAVAIKSGRSPPGASFFLTAVPFIRRGAFLLATGVGITLVTYVYLQGSGYVVFGILHLIGTSTILAPLFFRFRTRVVVPGVLLVLAGWLLPIPDGPLWLVWAGIHPSVFYSVDYTPLLPWMGIFLIGMAAGFRYYPEGVRSFWISPNVEHLLSFPAIPGRYSLLIYLIHQPVLIALLMVLSGKIMI